VSGTGQRLASTEALRTAHLDAVKKVRATITDPRHAAQLDTVIAALEKLIGGG
jgi:hypothetical protein